MACKIISLSIHLTRINKMYLYLNVRWIQAITCNKYLVLKMFPNLWLYPSVLWYQIVFSKSELIPPVHSVTNARLIFQRDITLILAEFNWSSNSLKPIVCPSVRSSGKITCWSKGPFWCSRRLQPSAGAKKKPPVGWLNF